MESAMDVGMMMVFASYGWEDCSDARVWDEEIRLARLAADLGFDLSLSRLNHRLPGRETHPEVMERTAQFHHEIAHAVLPQPDPVFDDAAALDAAVDMLDA